MQIRDMNWVAYWGITGELLVDFALHFRAKMEFILSFYSYLGTGIEISCRYILITYKFQINFFFSFGPATCDL